MRPQVGQGNIALQGAVSSPGQPPRDRLLGFTFAGEFPRLFNQVGGIMPFIPGSGGTLSGFLRGSNSVRSTSM